MPNCKTWQQVIDKFATGSTSARMPARATGGGWNRGSDYLPKGNCYVEGDTLYSYGSHWPLAVRVDPTRNGGVRFIINGDRGTVTTNAQQRYAIRQLGGNCQIPFSALARAFNEVGAAWVPPAVLSADFQLIAHAADRWEQRTNSAGLRLWERGWWVNREEKWSAEPPPEDPAGYAWRAVRDHYLGATLFRYAARYYLSGFDLNEPSAARHYFLTRLPAYCTPTTIAEAYYALKPEAVIKAERAGVAVLRQGDVFFIPTHAPGSKINSRQLIPPADSKQILATAHFATTVRALGATTLVRGTVTHRPDHAGPKHRRLKLGDGKTWYRAVRNTADGSWEAQGGID